MAIEHRLIAAGEIHEPKGVSSASSGEAYIADGSGSGNWQLPQIEGQGDAAQGEVPVADGTGGTAWVSPIVGNRVVMSAQDEGSQVPTGLDAPLQVTFGPAQNNNGISLASDGSITFTETGNYLLTATLRFSRTTTGGEADLITRYLVNGVQAGPLQSARLDDSDFTFPFTVTVLLNPTAGDVITVEFARDSADGGANNGSLEPYEVSATLQGLGWSSPAPSASFTIYQLAVGG